VIEKYKDVKLPLLLFILYTKPTGWQIVNDRYLYSQRGDIFKKQYNLKSKRKDKRKLTVHADGEILAEKISTTKTISLAVIWAAFLLHINQNILKLEEDLL
jgi:hypothetical protein